MRTYERYKDSGIEWIGKIPDHWEVSKLKFSGQSIIGLTYSPEEIVDDEKGYLVLRSSNIQNGKLSLLDNVYVKKKIEKRLITQIGDILICARNGSADLVGKNIMIDENTVGQTFGAFMTVFRGGQNHFVYWFLNSPFFEVQKGAFSTSTINQLTSNILNNLLIVLPPFPEQTAIANYLDNKTTEIGQTIADKEALINLFEEEKKALINEVVTKGLNPNAKLKPSGVDWLGDIPEHWEVKQFKYWIELITDKAVDQSNKVGLENIESNTGKFIETNSEFEGEGISFFKNDILFGKLRPYLVKVYLASFDGSAIGDFFVFRCREKLIPKFAQYKLVDYSFINICNSSTFGAKMPRVSWEFISNLKIAFPPTQEQSVIVNHIETETSIINEKISLTKQEIELLKEYRQALIFEAVTGKIKVSE